MALNRLKCSRLTSCLKHALHRIGSKSMRLIKHTLGTVPKNTSLKHDDLSKNCPQKTSHRHFAEAEFTSAAAGADLAEQTASSGVNAHCSGQLARERARRRIELWRWSGRWRCGGLSRRRRKGGRTSSRPPQSRAWRGCRCWRTNRRWLRANARAAADAGAGANWRRIGLSRWSGRWRCGDANLERALARESALAQGGHSHRNKRGRWRDINRRN
ncbi:hypothetical protein EVAR_90846_1 [Eumeta japonica]|uniref:Uncharacterized protein n=1 Tax=Eumeta variegata TaxID=151549 RepID=A0A4C1ZRN6_EUMVA|nr:hypothetical protein EVAR_90846_1 [Eumeta japonica]